MIAAGKLRAVVERQYKAPRSPDQSGTGEPEWDWAPVPNANRHRVQIKPITQGSREAFLSEEIMSIVSFEITMRYCAGVDAVQRLVKGSVIYTIHFVLDVDDMHKELKLYCSTGVNEG